MNNSAEVDDNLVFENREKVKTIGPLYFMPACNHPDSCRHFNGHFQVQCFVCIHGIASEWSIPLMSGVYPSEPGATAVGAGGRLVCGR